MAQEKSPNGMPDKDAKAPPAANGAGAGPAKTQGNPILILLAVLVGTFLLYWLTTEFMDWNKTQACVSYGGHNCSPRVPLDD
jgi:hypothetical protein